MNSLKRLGALLALSGVLLTACLIYSGAANAAPSSPSAKRHEDLLAPQERSALPRKFVQAALVPQPDRPKKLGGFKDKAGERVENECEFEYAPRVPQSCPAPERADHAYSWSWTSRAPPVIPA